MRRTCAGFTLLEMLVAIAIFASLALMALQVTNGVTRVNSAVAGHDQKLNLMQQTMSFLNHDLTQMMPRPVRGDQGQREPALLAGAGVLVWGVPQDGVRLVTALRNMSPGELMHQTGFILRYVLMISSISVLIADIVSGQGLPNAFRRALLDRLPAEFCLIRRGTER